MSDFLCDEVLSGRTPVEIVAESERAMAFRHTHPRFPVHIVVISRQHLPSLLETEDLGMQMELIQLVREVALGVSREHGGCRVIADLRVGDVSEHLQWEIIAGPGLQLR